MIDLALLKPDSKSVTFELMASISIPIPHTQTHTDLTCTISYITPDWGMIQPVFADLADGRSWDEIMDEAIACDAVVIPGLYLATSINPVSKDTTLDCVFTVEGQVPNLAFQEGIHLAPNVNVTRWPPKKKTN